MCIRDSFYILCVCANKFVYLLTYLWPTGAKHSAIISLQATPSPSSVRLLVCPTLSAYDTATISLSLTHSSPEHVKRLLDLSGTLFSCPGIVSAAQMH